MPATLSLNACLLACMALLAACTRPLAPQEHDFAMAFHGAALDTRSVRLNRGTLIGGITRQRPPRPQIACRERIGPPETGPSVTTSTAAFVLFETIFISRPWWRENYLRDWPRKLRLSDAMLLAHELTHVWQWQQRGTTGYSPLAAAAEHRPGGDPYLFEIVPGRRFLDFPYEQQAALLEEYVCCRTLAPDGARTERLRALLAPHFPPLRRPEALPAARVILPYPQADLEDVCA
ncbi:hypothetical protein [Profundibacterium mesophilum]|uniref:DUF4157 domain-containing protein n=1 Tax=Profundibacterium mesophilum KAUST100406-0324 TaxID=1037889 RepID=A0A921NQP7_9RHOB|nr:hypothetical protein [Profundibacterium mesophilum]KAF0676597.1 hypothetical protein PMES_01329 [Profundibacterium mesophilum KAUST100406-0324]